MRSQSMTSHFSFSSLVAGSSRRRRVMMNELVAQRLNLPDSPEITEQQEETKESHPPETPSDFENWVVSLNREPADQENNLVRPEEIDENLFRQLVSLSESEQVFEETVTQQKTIAIENQQNKLFPPQ